MGLLLDTATLIWWIYDARRLPAGAVRAVEDRSVFVSSVTAMELATKLRIGKLPQVEGLVAGFAEHCAIEGFEILPLRYEHALRGGSVPGDHRDPFDRMLAGQAIIEALTIVSPDAAFDALGARRLW